MPTWVKVLTILTTVPTWMTVIIVDLVRGVNVTPALFGSIAVVIGAVNGGEFVVNLLRKKTDGADDT